MFGWLFLNGAAAEFYCCYSVLCIKMVAAATFVAGFNTSQIQDRSNTRLKYII